MLKLPPPFNNCRRRIQQIAAMPKVRAYTALLLACFAVANVSSVALAGHDGTPLCGTDPTGHEDHCYARREKNYTDQNVQSVIAIPSDGFDPCVPHLCSNCPNFSAMSIWIAGVGLNYTPWVEIGIIKHDNGSNTFAPDIYSYCGNCSTVPAGKEMQGLGAKYTGSEWLQLTYSPGAQCWRWFVNGERKRSVCNSAGMNYGKHVRIGGEATNWSVDIGHAVLDGVQVFAGGQWAPFPPDNISRRFHYYNPSTGRTRYISKVAKATRGVGKMTTALSDHHYYHKTDACGETP
jgi:hypothetical protein